MSFKTFLEKRDAKLSEEITGSAIAVPEKLTDHIKKEKIKPKKFKLSFGDIPNR